MFTGIIEELGTVTGISHKINLSTLSIRAGKAAKGIKVGDSISVDGVCLTLTKKTGNRLLFDVMKETLDKTTIGRLKKNDRLNLERALKASDRISGHFVTGHIDGVGTITKITKKKNYAEIHVKAALPILRCIVPKGSVCVDGVSLTVGKVGKHYFSFYLIPYTKEVTTLGYKREGQQVNIETDILAKYIFDRS